MLAEARANRIRTNPSIKSEDRLKLAPQEELVICFGDGELDLSFYPAEVAQVIKAWNEGFHIADIAASLKPKRLTDELAILLMYLAIRKKIRDREGGYLGTIPLKEGNE